MKPKTDTAKWAFNKLLRVFGVEPKRTKYITVMAGDTAISLAEDGTLDVTLEDGSTATLMLMPAEVADVLAEVVDTEDVAEAEMEMAANPVEAVDVMAETQLRQQLAALKAENAKLKQARANAPAVVNRNAAPVAGANAKEQPGMSSKLALALESAKKANAERGFAGYLAK